MVVVSDGVVGAGFPATTTQQEGLDVLLVLVILVLVVRHGTNAKNDALGGGVWKGRGACGTSGTDEFWRRSED